MPKVVVQNIDPRIDGEYELVLVDDWTHDEWHRVKKVTGLRLGDFVAVEKAEAEDAEDEADADIVFAIGMVALERAGMQNVPALLKQGRLGDIAIVPDEVEEPAEDDDAGPPVPEPTQPGSDDESGSDTPSNGLSTSEPSAQLVSLPPPIGVRI